MSGRVAVITGASQGIGAALLVAYRELGYSVAASARTIAPADDPDVLAVAGDLARPGVGADLVRRALDRFGRIDTVVNNAGIFVAKPFTEYTDADFDAMTGVHLRGFFEVTQGAVPAMVTQGGGHVVNVSTSLVDNADSRVPSALAALTKGGLNAVTRSLAVEYAAHGIRVNTVALGVIRTWPNPAATDAALDDLHPLGHMGHIDDVVDAIRYLERAAFVTGEILHVDGGQSAGHRSRTEGD